MGTMKAEDITAKAVAFVANLPVLVRDPRVKSWPKTDVPMTAVRRRRLRGRRRVEKRRHDAQSTSKCAHDVAYFMLVQTRSADEPMTQFFRRTARKNQWKEN